MTEGVSRVQLTVNGKVLEVQNVAEDDPYTFNRKILYTKNGERKVLGEGAEIEVLIIELHDVKVDISSDAATKDEKVILIVNGKALEIATVDA